MSQKIETIRTRFAPSPTGYLHIGGLRTALYSYLYAKKTGGKFILRIEDTDLERYVDGAVQMIMDTLHETGIDYDEGPDVGGDYGPYIQSERKNEYLKYALQLVEKGEAYYCFCTKERLDSLTDETGAKKYDRHCLSLSAEEIQSNLKNGVPYVIRQKMPTEGVSTYEDMVFGTISVENKELEDNILIKSDGMPTYNFANVIDDHLMGINCVMRGTEYLSSTPKYNLLYDAFGWDRPIYVHMPPIMKDATHKLSKRNGDASYQDLKEKGFVKEAILNYIALLGWSPKSNQEKMTFDELKEAFSLEGISKSPSIFDETKLRWLNGLYLKEMDFDAFVAAAKPYLAQCEAGQKYDAEKLCRLAQPRVETLADVPQLVSFLTEFGAYDLSLMEHKRSKSNVETAKTYLPMVLEAWEALPQWNEESLHGALTHLIERENVKTGIIFWPARVAISAKESTPGGPVELADLLGREETLRRLRFSLDLLHRAE